MRQYLTILLFSALSFFTSVQVHALGATTGVNNPLFSVKNKDTKVSKVASAAATFFYNTTVAKHTQQQAAQLDAALNQLSLQTVWDAFLAAHGFEENTSCAGTSETLALAGAYPTHFGSHPNYDDAVRAQIDDLIETNDIDIFNLNGLSDTEITNIVNAIENRATNVLTNWLPPKLN